MINENTALIDLRLDVGEVMMGAETVSKVLNGFEKTSVSVGGAIAKAFAPVLNSFKAIQSGIGEMVAALSGVAAKLTEINAATDTAAENTGLFDGLIAGFNAILQSVDKLAKVEVDSAKFYSLFADVVTAPNLGALVKSVMPKTTEMADAAGEWAVMIGNGLIRKFDVISPQIGESAQKALGSITTAFSNFGSALGGMSVGKGAVIAIAIAAIVALVKLIVENWDAIKAALGAAAEWFNTNIIQPIVGFFTGLWASITTIVSDIWNGIVSVCTGVAQWFQDNVIQPVLDFFTPVVEWFSSLFSSVGQTVSDIFYNIVVLIKGYLELVFTIWKTIGIWFYENVIKPVAEFFVGLWENISAFAASAWETIKSVFFTVAAWFDANVIQPVANFFTGLWTGFLEAAQSAWDAVKNVFSAVTGFFKDIFSKAWEGVVKVFSVAGEIFTNLKEGILGVFKKIVNGLIEGINKVVSIPFNGINGALEVVKNIKILGLTPFAELRMISVPQIPYLAQGAVLPANKPFLAMVGDQKHGTNVEAPLATIQEAVALVMEDMVASNMAGHEATVAALRQILQAVMGIRVGDEVLGRAVDRYHSKMAVIHGGM